MKARYVKKKYKIRKRGFPFVLFIVSLAMYLTSSVFLKAYTYALSAELKKTENEITTALQTQDILIDEIRIMTNKERILEIAQADGLKNLQENVTYINSGE